MATPEIITKFKRTTAATALAVGVFAGSLIGTETVAASALDANADRKAAAIARTRANILPRAAASVLRLCAANRNSCTLKGLPGGSYQVRVDGVFDARSNEYFYDASYTADKNNRLTGFSVDKIDNTSQALPALGWRPEGVCDNTTMGLTCFASVVSGTLSANDMWGSYGGLAVAASPSEGNYRSSWGNVRDYPVHAEAAEFLAAYAVGAVEDASFHPRVERA